MVRRCVSWAGWFLVFALAGWTPPAAGAEAIEGFEYSRLFPGARFDPGVPTQEQVVGVRPGSRPLRHDEVLRYFEALADASPRAKLQTYSESHEGRALVYLAIGDEQVVADLDGFRGEHARRVDPRGRPATEDAETLQSARAVAWIAYGIHGDELSSSDAAVAVAYWLTAGEDERANELRRELLILIDPLENPDGRDRFLAQTRAFAHAAPNPDPEDLSHTTVWPWGRGNHYLFDLNRDWFTLVQPESRRSPVIASWNPQLMVDSHEMGSDDTYLFPPPRHPFNPHLPGFHDEWGRVFAADQAAALDERGYAYYTREWNEEFFPGYGSSWASYLGAIGILYEMSSTEGTLVRQRPGTLRTYPEAVEHHVASSVANLQTLADNRAAILGDYVAARREAIRRGREEWIRAWVFPPSTDPGHTRRLRNLVSGLGVETESLHEAVAARGLHDARTGERVDLELPVGTWRVRLDQPAAPMARVLLDPHVPMRSSFLQEERQYLERDRGTRLYETTAWSLPLAFGVPAYWTDQTLKGRWGAPPQEDPPVMPALPGPDGVYGYLLRGDRVGSSRALASLLQQGVATRVAARPFAVGGREYPRGTLLVKREGNPADLPQRLERLQRPGLEVAAVRTALAESGPDLGGRHFRPLVEPRVGVWTGWPIRPDRYGWLWHMLDRRLGLRFSALDLGRFGRTDLARYNVLVFPGAMGGASSWKAALGESGIERLREWVEAGGTAIGVDNGADFLADVETGLTETALRRQVLEELPPVVVGVDAPTAEAAGNPRAVGLRAEAEDGQRAHAPAADRSSPYDVAPVLGPGARPFTRGLEQGTPVALRPIPLADWLAPLLPAGTDEPADGDVEWADERLRRMAPQGALLRADLDPEHWLSFGLPASITTWVGRSGALVADYPVEVAARFAGLQQLHLSGLLWPEAAGRLARTAYCTREPVGRGQVILFLDNPAYRGWMRETGRMFHNAVLYGPGLGTRWSSPW